MNTYYLDSTSWINLAHSPPDRVLVLTAVEKNSIRVEAGWSVLDETTNEGVNNQSNYSDFLEDFWKIIRGRILLDTKWRMAIEFFNNKPLSEQDMYMRSLTERGILDIINESILKNVVQGVVQDKKDALARRTKDRENLLDYARSHNLTQSSPEWAEVENNYIAFAKGLASIFWSRTLEQSKFEELQTYSSYFYFELERLRLTVKDQKSAKRFEDHDQLVFVDARSSGCDFLVTDDGGLTKITNNLQRQLSSGPEAISHAKFIDIISK
jgi:hypothetical protein